MTKQTIFRGLLALIVCAILLALLLPAISTSKGYPAKSLPIKVRVIDTDENRPIENAKVTFLFGSTKNMDDSLPRVQEFRNDLRPSATTDADGRAQVTGTFRAWAVRSTWGSDEPWYGLLGDSWLKVEARGRPVAYVALDGHRFEGKRNYDNDKPLEVIVVMNKKPAL